jgi:hypothetical protein
MTDIVKKVAEDIAEMPADQPPEVIARVAIEAYQRELWPSYFRIEWNRALIPELRRNRASQLTAHIMSVLREQIRDDGFLDHHRDASEKLFSMFYESGADIITDLDRRMAGLATRGPYGYTAEELRVMEDRRFLAMMEPIMQLSAKPPSQ